MIRPARFANGSDSVFLWLACVLAACGGAYIVFGVLGSAIDRQAQMTNGISERMLADARVLTQRPVLDRAERTMDDRVRALDLHADKSTVVARFIRSAAAIAVAQHVDIERVEERATNDTPFGRAIPPRTDVGTGAIPLDVGLRGSYRDVLAATRAFAQIPLALRIDIAAIERSSDAGSPAAAFPLTAQLRVVIERFDDGLPPRRDTRQPPEESPLNARPL
jgi:hypothetical protein